MAVKRFGLLGAAALLCACGIGPAKAAMYLYEINASYSGNAPCPPSPASLAV